jgi:hypothetical protein
MVPQSVVCKFRKLESLANSSKRVYCIYTTLPVPGEDYGIQSVYGMNIGKIKDFFKKKENFETPYHFTNFERGNYRQLALQGDSLSVTVFNESGTDDTLIAAVQFKRTTFGAWINYICTTAKAADQSAFGKKVPFISNGLPFSEHGNGSYLAAFDTTHSMLQYSRSYPIHPLAGE